MRAKKSIRAWVARDSSGRLLCGIPSDAFPSIKWKDNEPTRVCIRIA